MSQIVILVLEDEPEVRDAVIRDLDPFTGTFPVEATEDADDARQVIAELHSRGDVVGLILCDHLLPGLRGTDFLVELDRDPETTSMRKILLTGQAGHDDTIRAINDGGLDHYVAKPWAPDELQRVVRDQLTEFVLAEADDLLPYVNTLDGSRLLEEISNRGWDR
ncbi:MAG: response regulator [Acidimicrobiia bacterium]|nr:response regulator [Acidimicrobiia bacterium]